MASSSTQKTAEPGQGSDQTEVPLAVLDSDLTAEVSRPAADLEVEGGDDRRVVGLGIFAFDSECGGLVVEDLVVDF